MITIGLFILLVWLVQSCNQSGATTITFYLISDESNLVNCTDSSNLAKAQNLNTVNVSTISEISSIWGTATYYGQICSFYNEFDIPGTPIIAKLELRCDDDHLIIVNSRNVNQNFISFAEKVFDYDILSFIKPGSNMLHVNIKNFEGPAYLKYKLSITTLVY